MSVGILLGVSATEPHSQEIFDMIAAATTELFQGKSVVAIEGSLKKTRP